ncbi:Capsule-associated protein [Colletotrichum higginsianum IMI 349063]|uniref:Capsule-associated protein n=2 Tax=Colletotrichum higginsianum (strain IMI 349063) TaxID=759273 RepID=A0A1B7Y0J3_COLHI|nr:Capsule-associated protein [Colletotrichum higginsianum IMI 349063]OBR05513.1 Capsule-associated protein [Colletotrichum higginsianum IMI 349063]
MMWKPPRSADVGSLTGSAGAATVYTVLAHCLSSERAEIPSELLCWLILPILFRSAHAHAKRHCGDDSKSSKAVLPSNTKQAVEPAPSSASLWIVAIGVVAVSIYKAECKRFITFLPLVSPILLAVQQYALRSEPASDPLLQPTAHSRISAFAFDTIPGTLAAGLLSTLVLSGGDLRASALSIVPVIAMLVVYAALEHGSTTERTGFFPRLEVQRSILPLAFRVFILLAVCLAIDTALFGFRTAHVPTTIALGIAKALSWYFTARAANDASWRIAPAIGTFSIASTRDPFTQPTETRALSNIAVSLLSLASVSHMTPQTSRTRSTLWILALVSLGPYLTNVIAIAAARSAAQSFAGHSHKHPVEILSRAGDAKFENLLKTQSQNYTEAHDEYRRRYGLEPPPGFEAWYEFAAVNESPVIDDFDSIFDAVSPFLALSGEEFGKVMRDVYDAPGSDLWLCSFSNARAETHCEHPYRTFDRHIAASFNSRLQGFNGGPIPDMQFIVNHLDEPRVLVPPTGTRDGGRGDALRNGRFDLKNMSGRPVHLEIVKYCESQELPLSHDEGMTEAISSSNQIYGLPFISHPSSATDLCRQPEKSALHGLVARPQSFRLIEGLVPVLSTGSLSTMGDILFPSPAYLEPEFIYDERHDVEWPEKRNDVYWAGSSTGGLASDERWMNYQRQRFVALAQNLQKPEKQEHVYLRHVDGVVERVKSSFLNSRLYDVAFTRIFQCERRQCRDQKSYFEAKSWADKDEALRSRLVFDLDGNGISGRYYKLLASRSVPLKQTLLREWHDERLVPWVHYVPVSLGMEELPELVTYLTTTEAGQQRAQQIAEQGRDWYSKAFREVDFAVYSSRLMLELARLQDPDRQALGKVTRPTP